LEDLCSLRLAVPDLMAHPDLMAVFGLVLQGIC
jgi:hypothetical protein